MKRKFKRLVESEFTDEQQELIRLHGTPAEFALSIYKSVPSDISMDEAEESIQKYRREFHKAGKDGKV